MHLDGAYLDFHGCFGSSKQSENGCEWGEAELNEFLELKALFAYARVVTMTKGEPASRRF